MLVVILNKAITLVDRVQASFLANQKRYLWTLVILNTLWIIVTYFMGRPDKW